MAKAKARPLSCPAQGPPPRGSRCRAWRGQTSPSKPLPGSQPWLDPWLRELRRADSPSSHRRPPLLGRRGTRPLLAPPPRMPLQPPPLPISFAGALPLPPPPPPQLLFIHARHCPRDLTLLWVFLPRPPILTIRNLPKVPQPGRRTSCQGPRRACTNMGRPGFASTSCPGDQGPASPPLGSLPGSNLSFRPRACTQTFLTAGTGLHGRLGVEAIHSWPRAALTADLPEQDVHHPEVSPRGSCLGKDPSAGKRTRLHSSVRGGAAWGFGGTSETAGVGWKRVHRLLPGTGKP